MGTINNKSDFMILIKVENCNPNGDPVYGNHPRIDDFGYGEISDVCLKRKIRNRLQDMGEEIFMVSSDRINDGLLSSSSRLKKSGILENIKANENYETIKNLACNKWIDTRMFGQLIATKASSGGLSIGVRGAISIGAALSIAPVRVRERKLTKSFNFEDKDGRDSTTFGAAKYIVAPNIYVAKGSIFPQMAESVNLSLEDVELFKECISTLFVNDATSARPAGSMEVAELLWFTHKSKNGDCSPSKIFNSVKISPKEDYPFYEIEYPGDIKNVDFEVTTFI